MKKPKNPLVSVIIPFLNVQQFLRETVESVVSQEYNNWEIVLIDDGSTDGSTEIAMQLASEYKGQIIYAQHTHHNNRGAAASRNLGVSRAQGEWLAFLDADDLWLPQKLKVQLELLEQNPEATAICEATTYWYDWCSSQSKNIRIPVGAEPDRLYAPPSLASILYPLGKGHSFATCGLMLKRNAFLSWGGFDESFTGNNQLYEDQVLYTKIYLHEKVYISSKSNNLYRQRPDSLMHGLLSKGYYMEGRYYFLQWLARYLREKNISDKKLWNKLNRAFWPYKYPLLYRFQQLPVRVIRKLNSMMKR